MDSPCLKCKKITDPYECTYKDCPEWRSWWLDRWNKMRECWLAKNHKEK